MVSYSTQQEILTLALQSLWFTCLTEINFCANEMKQIQINLYNPMSLVALQSERLQNISRNQINPF